MQSILKATHDSGRLLLCGGDSLTSVLIAAKCTLPRIEGTKMSLSHRAELLGVLRVFAEHGRPDCYSQGASEHWFVETWPAGTNPVSDSESPQGELPYEFD